MKLNDYTPTEIKRYEPKPTISPVAVEMWTNVIRNMFESKFSYKHVIIPVIEYTPNLDYDNGSISKYKVITVNYNNVKNILQNYKIEDNLEVALSRNILLIEKERMAQFITLDIIDVKPNCEEDKIKTYSNEYYIVKTKNSYHLYPKNTPNRNTNYGNGIRDINWKQEYIRITDSEAKGTLTKLDNT